MTQTAQDIANDILDWQAYELRERLICSLLHHGYGPEVISASMGEIDKCIAKVRASQAAKVLAEVLLVNCLAKTGGKA